MSLDAALIKQITQARKVVAIGVVGGYELDIIDIVGVKAPARVVFANGKRRIWPNLSKLSAESARQRLTEPELAFAQSAGRSKSWRWGLDSGAPSVLLIA